MSDALESWNLFLPLADCQWCWWCGRGREHRPSFWGAPYWIVERAHIVNQPRRKDRHAAVLLCSWCHRLQHGDRFAVESLPGPTIGNMIWLKMKFDPKYYDRKFLQENTVGRLPRASKPPAEVLRHYFDLRGYHH